MNLPSIGTTQEASVSGSPNLVRLLYSRHLEALGEAAASLPPEVETVVTALAEQLDGLYITEMVRRPGAVDVTFNDTLRARLGQATSAEARPINAISTTVTR